MCSGASPWLFAWAGLLWPFRRSLGVLGSPYIGIFKPPPLAVCTVTGTILESSGPCPE